MLLAELTSLSFITSNPYLFVLIMMFRIGPDCGTWRSLLLTIRRCEIMTKLYPVNNFSELYPITLEKMSYSDVQPYDSGMLDVGDGHHIYWETCGNPDGKPVLVVHGGPGSGANPYWRQFFNPNLYHIILFDQRGCGRSLPNAGDTGAALIANTTEHLISDMEKIRMKMKVDKWMLFAGSWAQLFLWHMQ